MKGRFFLGIILLISLSGLFSCKRNRYRVINSSVKADIEVKRLENDLFRLDPSAIKDSLPVLREKYGDFLQYFSYVIEAGDTKDTSFGDYLTAFCTDKLNNEVYAAVSRLILTSVFWKGIWERLSDIIPIIFRVTPSLVFLPALPASTEAS